jgi:hypothetical protein
MEGGSRVVGRKGTWEQPLVLAPERKMRTGEEKATKWSNIRRKVGL